MDYKVIWTPQGIETLREAVEYIAQDNSSAARKMGDAILKKALLLEDFPRLGKVFAKLGRDDVREISVPPYRIIYQIRDSQQTIFVLTVWHGARQEPEL